MSKKPKKFEVWKSKYVTNLFMWSSWWGFLKNIWVSILYRYLFFSILPITTSNRHIVVKLLRKFPRTMYFTFSTFKPLLRIPWKIPLNLFWSYFQLAFSALQVTLEFPHFLQTYSKVTSKLRSVFCKVTPKFHQSPFKCYLLEISPILTVILKFLKFFLFSFCSKKIIPRIVLKETFHVFKFCKWNAQPWQNL